jgi:hypothetical protein
MRLTTVRQQIKSIVTNKNFNTIANGIVENEIEYRISKKIKNWRQI